VIFAPPNWRVHPTAEGAILDGPAGRILHVERARPLLRLGDFARGRVAPGTPLGAVEPLVTDEGELGALLTAGARVWGVVYAEDYFAWYEGNGDVVAPIRALVRAHRLGLGPRRRRFRYVPPAGWDGIARGLITDWLSPDFPGTWGVITAYPTELASTTSTAIVSILLARAASYGFVADAPPEVADLEPRDGLAGIRAEVRGKLSGQPVQRALAAFLDRDHVYALELQCRTPVAWIEHHSVFLRLCESVERLPQPRVPSTWVE
jgi:hypothetical protein